MLFQVLGIKKDSLSRILDDFGVKSPDRLLDASPDVVETIYSRCTFSDQRTMVLFGKWYFFVSITDHDKDKNQKWLTIESNGHQLTLLVKIDEIND